MEILKKPKYIFMTVLQVLLLVSSFILNYFTIRKMGMARHMLYLNGKLPEFIQIYAKPLVIFVIALVTLITTRLLIKKNNGTVLEKTSRVTYIILLSIMLFINPKINKAAYVMLGIYSIIAILEFLKVLWIRNDL